MPSDDLALPQSVHTEIAILGASLLDPAALHDAADKLIAEDFSLDSHQRIYRAILAVQADHMGVDLNTVRAELDNRHEMEAVGGIGYLMELTSGIPRHFNIESYIAIVKDKALLRSAMSVGHDSMVRASDPSEDPQEVIERAIEDYKAILDRSTDTDLQRVGDYMAAQGPEEEATLRMATTNGIRLGWRELDEVTMSPKPGEFWVVAARPETGKTAWLCTAAYHTSVREQKKTAAFTLEQQRRDIIRRMLSQQARLNYHAIRKNALSSQDKNLLMEYRAILAQAPLYLEDRAGLTVTRIRSKCERLKRREGLDIVFIDQLSHVNRSDVYQRGIPKHEQVGEQSRRLKLMARELDIPVVLFNQIGRESTKRTDHRPTKEDLAESGSLEQDADVIVLLHRPEIYDKGNEDVRGKGEMIVAKQREGETKTIHCAYNGSILRWEESQARTEW